MTERTSSRRDAGSPADSATPSGANRFSYGEEDDAQFFGSAREDEVSYRTPEEAPQKKCISVGDYLPFGPRMFYNNLYNVVRMKDIGEQNRIILVGVIGSFTPDCWNRHLFLVLRNLEYYEQREIDYICCISTNDAFTQRAWGEFLACTENVLMWSDATTGFTKALGMDVVVPWLDDKVRSKRYVIYAEDMQVTKIISPPDDGPNINWRCEHFPEEGTTKN